MSEYILRNEALQRLHEAGGCDATDEWARGYDAGITEAIDIIDNISPTDVAPVVHGHWIYLGGGFAKCSVCKWVIKDCYDQDNEDLFCRKCAAKMDESEDKNDV